MTIFHFIPAHEESLHETSNECRCEPKLVPVDELEDCGEDLIGETAYAHNPLTETVCDSYVIKS